MLDPVFVPILRSRVRQTTVPLVARWAYEPDHRVGDDQRRSADHRRHLAYGSEGAMLDNWDLAWAGSDIPAEIAAKFEDLALFVARP